MKKLVISLSLVGLAAGAGLYVVGQCDGACSSACSDATATAQAQQHPGPDAPKDGGFDSPTGRAEWDLERLANPNKREGNNKFFHACACVR